MKSKIEKSRRWALVLAGGNGHRLADLASPMVGNNIPKQFCRFFHTRSLLEQTRSRIELLVPKQQVYYALVRAQESYFVPQVCDLSFPQLVVQPANRGTAPAVIYSLMRLGLADPNAYVAVFPSDHFVGNDYLFMQHVRSAFDVLAEHPELVIVLGIPPRAPETDRSWIEPASAFITSSQLLFDVRRFIEKPPLEVAQRLCAYGRCLWNSSILVARLPNLLALTIHALPDLYDRFAELQDVLGTQFESEAIEYTYRSQASTSAPLY